MLPHLQVLLAEGASVHLLAASGDTALLGAARRGHAASVQALLQCAATWAWGSKEGCPVHLL